MNILGISAFYHDSAAVLVVDGKIVAACQEERFTRKKHDNRFPAMAIESVLKIAGLKSPAIDAIVYYENPWIKINRIVDSFLYMVPQGARLFPEVMVSQGISKLWIKHFIRQKLNYRGPIQYVSHHHSHAASAFYPSPFNEAAFLTIDGVGEWDTTTYGVGKLNRLDIHRRIRFPHSLGLLYAAFTYFTGFKVNSGEYKVMGLAPYGEPKYVQRILDHLIDIKDDGSFRLNMKYFDYVVGTKMTNEAFAKLFDRQRRNPESLITQDDMDLARSIQEVTELVMLKMARHIRRETGMRHLCLAGGVALNCVANGKIAHERVFDDIWIQPSAGDAGGALGAALYYWYQSQNNPRQVLIGQEDQGHTYFGPAFSWEDIEGYLKSHQITYQYIENIEHETAKLLGKGNIIGWFSGAMEFGPRALGARSILGDPRVPDMQKRMNLKIKYRESFRPFAPSVLEEKVADWFEYQQRSPYMLIVAPVQAKQRISVTPEQQKLFGIERLNGVRSQIPAVTHVDYSARIQTVNRQSHARYYGLLKYFEQLTGCPVLINTSFNVRGEPIVCTPEDAYRCFMRTEMDYLVLENFLIDKKQQPVLKDETNWKEEFTLD
jgi:carbamoyltransferase